MTGYRRVNYYELCRLCTSNEGIKLPIFKDEGRSRQLPSKIQICLRLQVSEADNLPKYICSGCLDKLECCFEFRSSCASAEVMLQSYATALKNNVDFQREGMVYIKENKLNDSEEQEVHEVHKNDDITVLDDDAHTHPGLPVHLDSFASLVEAATIQIIPDIHDPHESKNDPLWRFKELGAYSDTSKVPSESPKPEISTEVHQSEDDQEESETSDHTITIPGAGSHHELVLLHCDTGSKNGDQDDSSTIIGHVGSDEDPRTTIHMEEFLKLKCSDINKNHSEEDSYLMFEPNKVTQREEVKATFQCDICTKQFKRKEHLYQHKKLHTGERPFKCPHCVRTFSRKEHLVRHAHSHTGQKLFNCDICGKSFSRKDNVRKHRKTHDAAGPHCCEFCGMQFNVRPYYLMHKNKHKDGSCALEKKPQGVQQEPEEEQLAAYETTDEGNEVHSNENSFQQVTSSTSTSILERALKKDG